jgi:hypothetical protein
VTSDQALAAIRGYAELNQVVIVPHAQQRMYERSIKRRDILCALTSAASRCRAGARPGRWKVTGPDLDGDDLSCVCAIESGVVVITVF